MSFDLTYISLGAGVQSSALYALSSLGEIPRADVAIFADTQAEPRWVYQQLERLRDWSKKQKSPIPIETVTAGNLMQDIVDRHNGKFAAIPAYTTMNGKVGMLRRQCTREYKIDPIQKRVKEMLGYRPRQHVRKMARALIGISADEAQRAKPSRERWIVNEYPLLDLRMRWQDCQRVTDEQGLGQFKKSACIFCPFRSDDEWRDIKQDGGQWSKAVKFDYEIRDMGSSGIKQSVYLHRSAVPLDQVKFERDGLFQPDMFGNECEGMCGT